MEKIQNQKHSLETLYYGLSRMFERASFYGLRAIFVLYLMSETLNMEQTEAFTVYGYFTGTIVFSQLLGALLGDFLLGTKNSILIGGVLQAIGAFSFCIPTTFGLYIGITLMVLGNGLFTPNIIANYGKSYLNRPQLLDAGFTIFYLAINLGSFFGVFFIGLAGEKYGFDIGFIISGILMLLSLIPILFTKEPVLQNVSGNGIGKRVLKIAMAFVFVGVFWGIYEISNLGLFQIQGKLSEISSLGIPKLLWSYLNLTLILPISIIAIVIWTFYYNSQFTKLFLGFLFGALAYGTLLFIPDAPFDNHTKHFLLAILLLAISEIHIAPIVYSILTKYTNPKYLATIISLSFLPTKLITLGFGLFFDRFYNNPTLGLQFGIIAMALVSILLLIYLLVDKKTISNNLDF